MCIGEPPTVPPNVKMIWSHSAPAPGLCSPLSARLTGMGTLVLLRHGESEWNTKGLFTGWVDVGLAPKGAQEAAAAGRMVVDAGACAPTSCIRRCSPARSRPRTSRSMPPG